MQGCALEEPCIRETWKQLLPREINDSVSAAQYRCGWAYQDLDLGPHPYQQSRAKRHADRRFPRSPASVMDEVIRC